MRRGVLRVAVPILRSPVDRPNVRQACSIISVALLTSDQVYCHYLLDVVFSLSFASVLGDALNECCSVSPVILVWVTGRSVLRWHVHYTAIQSLL